MKLPLYTTIQDYETCEAVVKNLLRNGESAREIALRIMHICYATGGDYSEKTISAYAKAYIERLAP